MKHFGTRDYLEICQNNDDGQVVICAGQEGYEGDELTLNFSPEEAGELAGEILACSLQSVDPRIVSISLMAITEDGEIIDLGVTECG